MSRRAFYRGLAMLVLATVLTVVGGCESAPAQTEQPGSSEAPASAEPRQTPSGAGLQPGVEPGAAEERFPLVGEQPYGFPGMYEAMGMTFLGSDHFALVSSSLPCEELASALEAGEWLTEGKVVFPSFDGPGGPPWGIWLYLERGQESLIARLGGDDYCGGRLVRSSAEAVMGSGAFDFEGRAKLLQESCFVGAGRAEMRLSYYGPEDVRLLVDMALPLVEGETLPESLEVTIVRSELMPRDYYAELGQAVARGQLEGFEFGPPGSEFFAEQVLVRIDSIEPLTGVLEAELFSELGAAQTLEAAFRCDAPPGELTAAASQAVDRPDPATPEPPSASGTLTLDVASGRHAGRHSITSSEVLCSYNLFSDGAWMAGYLAEEETRPGELASLQLTLRQDGSASVLALLGEDFDEDWLDTEQARGELRQTADLTELTASGTSRTGVQFKVSVNCAEVTEF